VTSIILLFPHVISRPAAGVEGGLQAEPADGKRAFLLAMGAKNAGVPSLYPASRRQGKGGLTAKLAIAHRLF